MAGTRPAVTRFAPSGKFESAETFERCLHFSDLVFQDIQLLLFLGQLALRSFVLIILVNQQNNYPVNHVRDCLVSQ